MNNLPLEVWGLIVSEQSDTRSNLNLFSTCALFHRELPQFLQQFQEGDYHFLTDQILKKFPGLTYMNLSSNFNVTDDGISHLVKLEMLDLSTHIRPVGIRITNDGIQHLTNLTNLNLWGNYKITKFPTKRLNILSLRSIQPFHIPTALIEECTNLTVLDLGHSRHCEKRIEFQNLDNLVQLTSLDASHSPLIKPDQLLKMTNLTNLSIPFYQPIHAEKLNFPFLRRLNIYSCRISPNLLTTLTNLTDLNAPLRGDQCILTDPVLACLTQLTYLNITRQRELTPDSLKKLVCLKFLVVYDVANLVNLEVLSLLTNLKVVDTCGSEIEPHIKKALGSRLLQGPAPNCFNHISYEEK